MYGKDVCLNEGREVKTTFQSCFVNPDDDCVGDFGYG